MQFCLNMASLPHRERALPGCNHDLRGVIHGSCRRISNQSETSKTQTEIRRHRFGCSSRLVKSREMMCGVWNIGPVAFQRKLCVFKLEGITVGKEPRQILHNRCAVFLFDPDIGCHDAPLAVHRRKKIIYRAMIGHIAPARSRWSGLAMAKRCVGSACCLDKSPIKADFFRIP